MKFLCPKSRAEPRYEATLDEVFEDIEFIPYSKHPVQREGWLFLSTMGMNEWRGGCHYAKFRPQLLDMLAPSIFSNKASVLHQELSAELIDQQDGTVKLYLSFTLVSGAYCLLVTSKDEALTLIDRHKEAT